MANYCTECGTRLLAGASYCIECGHKLPTAQLTTPFPYNTVNTAPRLSFFVAVGSGCALPLIALPLFGF